jgi:hypothetical protein
MYFPGVDFGNFTKCMKDGIEEDIANDFHHAYEGIIKLPLKSRFGVYVAYKYYLSLFRKIKKTQPERIMEERIRIPNSSKYALLMSCYIKNNLNLI